MSITVLEGVRLDRSLVTDPGKWTSISTSRRRDLQGHLGHTGTGKAVRLRGVAIGFQKLSFDRCILGPLKLPRDETGVEIAPGKHFDVKCLQKDCALAQQIAWVGRPRDTPM